VPAGLLGMLSVWIEQSRALMSHSFMSLIRSYEPIESMKMSYEKAADHMMDSIKCFAGSL
jgi:hypothetical protein